MGLSAAIEQGWWRRGALAWMLLPLSWLFAALAALRRLFYRLGWLRSSRLPVPVVVVGNITVGGSGKTPLVIWLAHELGRHGYAPGIISRGYGGTATGAREVRGDDDAALVGDEPLLLARRSGCPVWIGRDRVEAGTALLAAHPDCKVVIADDGLQHYRLARDVELVVMDERGVGNGWQLPAGPLREPLRRLRDVDAIVSNGDAAALRPGLPDPVPARESGAPRFAMRLVGRRLCRLSDPGYCLDAAAFAGKRLHALAGIGNPPRFFAHLAGLGLKVVEHPFPDHHAYVAGDLRYEDCDALLMTEKDAVKCAPVAPPGTWVLRVDAEIDPGLLRIILEKIDGFAFAGYPRLPRDEGASGL